MIEPPDWMSEHERAELRRIYDPQPMPGIGDVVAGATKAVGMQPCTPCRRRQQALNAATPRWVGRLLAGLSRLAARLQVAARAAWRWLAG